MVSLPSHVGVTPRRSPIRVRRPNRVTSHRLIQMNPPRAILACLLLVTTSLLSAAAQDDAKWKLVWQDEFDADVLDPKKWDRDLGNGFFNYDANQWIAGWGNG